mgnify:CR=1 FL=1
MRKIYEAAVLFIGTLGWWGFVYPELCLDEQAYEEEVCEDVDGQEFDDLESVEEEDEETDLSCLQLGGIRIKSRLAEYVYHRKENAAENKLM